MRARFNSGRWMKEEHEAFLHGLALYQKEWDLIASVVTTRTVLQVRTHGQKYFAKLQKGEVFPEEPYQSMYAWGSNSTSSGSAALPPPPFIARGGVPQEQRGHGGGGTTPTTDTMPDNNASPSVGNNTSFGMPQQRGGVSTGGGGGGGGWAGSTGNSGPRSPGGGTSVSDHNNNNNNGHTAAAMTAPAPPTPFCLASLADSGSSSADDYGGATPAEAGWCDRGAPGGSPGENDGGDLGGGGGGGRNWSADRGPECQHHVHCQPDLNDRNVVGISSSASSTDGAMERPRATAAGGANELVGMHEYSAELLQQQQQQYQHQQQMPAYATGWHHHRHHHHHHHQQPLVPEGLGPIEGWLDPLFLWEQDAGADDPDGETALRSLMNDDVTGAL